MTNLDIDYSDNELDGYDDKIEGSDDERHEDRDEDVQLGKQYAREKRYNTIYDQADSTFDGRQYASADSKKDDSPIEGPALTILGMTTASTLYPAHVGERV
jgi:hypothetical protein